MYTSAATRNAREHDAPGAALVEGQALTKSYDPAHPERLALRGVDLAVEGRGAGVGPELGAPAPAADVAAACLGMIALAAGLGALVARRAARAPVAETLRAE